MGLGIEKAAQFAVGLGAAVCGPTDAGTAAAHFGPERVETRDVDSCYKMVPTFSTDFLPTNIRPRSYQYRSGMYLMAIEIVYRDPGGNVSETPNLHPTLGECRCRHPPVGSKPLIRDSRSIISNMSFVSRELESFFGFGNCSYVNVLSGT